MVRKITTEEFIQRSRKIHGDKYDYSKTIYEGSHCNVLIICYDHGEFIQKAHNHIGKKYGCRKCVFKKQTLTNDEFIKRCKNIHGDKYDYSKVNYTSIYDKVIIICKKHGEFEQIANKHVNSKQGCPKCSNSGFSRIAIEWLQEVEKTKKIKLRHALHKQGEYRINYKDHNGKNKYYFIDGYHVATKTVYEFHGDRWHGNPNKFHPDDVNPVSKVTYGMLMKNTLHKELRLRNMGYKYVCIWESEYNK